MSPVPAPAQVRLRDLVTGEEQVVGGVGRVLAMVGYRPDTALTQELQVTAQQQQLDTGHTPAPHCAGPLLLRLRGSHAAGGQPPGGGGRGRGLPGAGGGGGRHPRVSRARGLHPRHEELRPRQRLPTQVITIHWRLL